GRGRPRAPPRGPPPHHGPTRQGPPPLPPPTRRAPSPRPCPGPCDSGPPAPAARDAARPDPAASPLVSCNTRGQRRETRRVRFRLRLERVRDERVGCQQLQGELPLTARLIRDARQHPPPQLRQVIGQGQLGVGDGGLQVRPQ